MEPKPASPLPWRLEHDGPDSHMVLPVVVDAAGATVADTDNASELNLDDVEHSVDDMGYIVAACNAYPGLVARIAALEAENARMREALERIGEWTIYDPCIPTTYDAKTAAMLMREMRDIAKAALAPQGAPMSKELEMLRKWCDETLNWRNAHIADLRRILARLEAAERVCGAAEVCVKGSGTRDDPIQHHVYFTAQEMTALRNANDAYRALDGQAPDAEARAIWATRPEGTK